MPTLFQHFIIQLKATIADPRYYRARRRALARANHALVVRDLLSHSWIRMQFQPAQLRLHATQANAPHENWFPVASRSRVDLRKSHRVNRVSYDAIQRIKLRLPSRHYRGKHSPRRLGPSKRSEYWRHRCELSKHWSVLSTVQPGTLVIRPSHRGALSASTILN